MLISLGAALRQPRTFPPLISAAASMATATASGHHRLILPDLESTLALGARLAEVAQAGDVVLLRGDYGSGKTCLARGFVVRWCGDPNELVTSPSYLIDNVYDDPDGTALQPGVTVHHMDLWRLPEGKVQQLVDLDSVFKDSVSLIEWPDKLGASLMPTEYLEIDLSIIPEGSEPELGAELVQARAGVATGGGADSDEDDDADEDDDTQMRLAMLTACGSRWEERLQAIIGEAS